MIPIIGAEYPAKVVPLVDAAKKNIDIVVYDWRWYQDQAGHPVQIFNAAIVRAVKRGVQVRAVLNMPDLVPLLKEVGIKARTTRDKRTLHCKLMVIDEALAVIGSHNFTRNAFGSNVEASVAVDIPDGERRFSDFFERLWQI